MYERIIEFLIETGYIGVIIAGLSEALFLPFPMEVVFLPIVLAATKRAVIYTVLLIASSFVGSIIAYWIGKFGGQKVLKKLGFANKYYDNMERMYSKSSFIVIMSSSFTPIPYEVYTLTAGMFNVNLRIYIAASILSRVIRYVPQGILLYLYGEKVLSLVKQFGVLSIIFLFIIMLIIRAFIIKVKNRHS